MSTGLKAWGFGVCRLPAVRQPKTKGQESMTTDHDREPGDDGYRATPTANPRRGGIRKVAAVAGAAAVLGTAAYATTTWVMADDQTETKDVTAMAPRVSAGDPEASAPASAPVRSAGCSSATSATGSAARRRSRHRWP